MAEIHVNVEKKDLNYTVHKSDASPASPIQNLASFEYNIDASKVTPTSKVEPENIVLDSSTVDSSHESDIQRLVRENRGNGSEIEKLSVADFIEEGVENIKSGIAKSFGKTTIRDDAMSCFSYNDIEGIDKNDIEEIGYRGPDLELLWVKLKDGSTFLFYKNTRRIWCYETPSGISYYFDDDGDIIQSDSVESSDIYSDSNISYEQYGGSQMAFSRNTEELLEDPTIRNILLKNFPDATEEDYVLYMKKISNVGCAYTATVNTIFEKFMGKEQEFKDTFGFAMYKLDESGTSVFNYEPLILAYFTYVWHDYYEWTNIEDIYGNIGEMGKVTDSAISGQTSTGATGHSTSMYEIFNEFLKDKYGIDSTIEHIPETMITPEIFEQIIQEGKFVICRDGGYNLYKYDESTGERGALYMENGGRHAVQVTGFTDNGDVIVSSWGKKYILEQADTSLVIYDINI